MAYTVFSRIHVSAPLMLLCSSCKHPPRFWLSISNAHGRLLERTWYQERRHTFVCPGLGRRPQQGCPSAPRCSVPRPPLQTRHRSTGGTPLPPLAHGDPPAVPTEKISSHPRGVHCPQGVHCHKNGDRE